MSKEVVITGMGVVSPLGNTPEELLENLLKGKSGIRTISRFDIEKYPVKIGGEVTDFDPTPYETDIDWTLVITTPQRLWNVVSLTTQYT